MAELIAEFENKQAAIRFQGKITSFFDDFQIGSLLNRAGIRKLKGISPLTLFATIFSLTFEEGAGQKDLWIQTAAGSDDEIHRAHRGHDHKSIESGDWGRLHPYGQMVLLPLGSCYHK